MAVISQLKYYSTNTVGSPPINGLSGSLMPVLDFCLVSGSGWTKTFSSSSADGTNIFAAYRPASGSRFYLFVNDSGPGVSAGGAESWICGWENFIGLNTPAGGNATGSEGSGSGQFPLASRGHVVLRKSAGFASVLERQWYVFADAYTMYMFINSEGNIPIYFSAGFGDIYSFGGTQDVYRGMIYGRAIGASAGGGTTVDYSDGIRGSNTTVANAVGAYMPRTFTGTGVAIQFLKYGNSSFCGTPAVSNPAVGTIPTPNPVDGSYYLFPILVGEQDLPILRGRFRGWYHLCHPLINFIDGQIFQGTGDNYGKTFMVIHPGPNNGMYCIEISNTVEAN